MYNAKYKIEIGKDSEGNKYTKSTTLNATFVFGNEVPRNHWRKIEKRMSCFKGGLLNNYLIEKEGLEYKGNGLIYHTFIKDSKKVKINAFPVFTPGDLVLKVKAEALGPCKKKDIINLNKLKDFILTGKS